MLYRLALLMITSLSSLYGNEYHIITAENCPGIGMFAIANQILGRLHLFDTGQAPHISGFKVDFGEYGLYYDPIYGENWWEYYFEPLNIGKRENAEIIYPTKEQYRSVWQHRYLMPRAVAAKVVEKYIHVKPHIQKKIDEFVAKFFDNNYVIGIHYRGTDKKNEAPRVEYEDVFNEVEKSIPKDKAYLFFVATDEIEFLEEIKEKYPDHVIAIDAHRLTSGDLGVHFNYKNNYSIGEEALIDTVLLSRCDLLIRTSSNLSLWSTYFNPNLPVVLLNLRKIQTLEPE